MKRIWLLLIISAIALSLMLSACGHKKEVAPETTTTPTVAPPPETTKAVEPPPPPPKPVLKESQFQTVYFDFDKYNLRADARAALDHNFQLLQEFPDVIIKIEGHCDERGTVEYNLSLGEKRAQAAKTYLVTAGISADRIQTISYGKERPVDPGHNEAAWAKNRRCEFRIISQ
jgi:peptidoglycan-associated lipoprotein